MKALVLAGGSGVRLRPLSLTLAKQLLPVANRPILFHVIDDLVDAGIRDIGVIVAPQTGEGVCAAVGDGARWGARITYLRQDQPAGIAHAVSIARPFLGDSDFCLYLGDVLLGERIRGPVDSFLATPDLDASVLVKEVSDPSMFGVAELDEHGQARRFVEKPTTPTSNLATVGVYLLRASIFSAIERLTPSARGELEITDALTALLTAGGHVRCERLTSWWRDTGSRDGLLAANELVLRTWMTPENLGTVDSDSDLRGPIRIEEGASILRSTIEGPALIGRGARIVDARIGPSTSVGDGVVVEGASIKDSILLEETRVIGRFELNRSLIGRRCHVEVEGRYDGSAELMLGDDSTLALYKNST